MDNFGGFNMLPPSLAVFLTNDLVARDTYLGLNELDQQNFVDYAREFQSKEEMERYLYHRNEDDFR
ncbi:MAG: hypothetical protein K0R05_1883 [Anaerocolumna sp.]|jgi:hypothetical protein|nr:hypothetical protein [Anaerocolumna sp.]